MRAMVLRGRTLSVEEVERPRPGPGQVLARVRACGVCGSDLHYARFADQFAGSGALQGTGAMAGADGPPAIIMGHEYVAEVVETGPGVTSPAPGTRVTSVPVLPDPASPRGTQAIGYSPTVPGAYGEYILLSSSLALPVPDGVSDVLGSATEPCAVGLHAVRQSHVDADERVLVMGAGPIGLMTLLWLKQHGVRQVVVSEPAPPRREMALRLGADAVLDPSQGEVGTRFAEAAGGPPGVVFECVGVPGTLQQAIELVERQGRIVVVGVCMQEDRIRPSLALTKHLPLQFVLGYSADEFAETLDAITAGAVDPAPMITGTVTLDELPRAFEELGDPRDCMVTLVFP